MGRYLADQLLIPMAISLGYGVLYASLMTLFMVPCGYVILDDWASFLRRQLTRRESTVALGPEAEIVPISDDFEIATGQQH